MKEILNNPLVMLLLTILAYFIGERIQKKTHFALANPLLIALILMISLVVVSGISVESYDKNTQILSRLLGPATMCLGIVVYRQKELFKRHWKAILGGTFIGSITSMGSVIVLSKLFGVENALMVSMLPKSVTTPIAMSVSETLNGIIPITVAVVIVTGILGSVLGPYMLRLAKNKNRIASGVAYGTSAHALGSAKAVESGEIEGAMASIALIVNGILTVLIVFFMTL